MIYLITTAIGILTVSLLCVQYKDSYIQMKVDTGATDRDVLRWIRYKIGRTTLWTLVGIACTILIALFAMGLWHVAAGISTTTGAIIMIMLWLSSEQRATRQAIENRDKKERS